MRVISIQIGISQPLNIDGRQVLSAITKTPVIGQVTLGKLGLEGDEQADLSVHGGLAKAVYAFPAEHYSYWQQQAAQNRLERELAYGSLGENLTLNGLLESDVFVGDELHFSNCVLRITEPRQPCYKFNAIMNDRLAAKKMVQTGFSGFYLSVKQSGSLAAGETFELVPGKRSTPLSALATIGKLKTRND